MLADCCVQTSQGHPWSEASSPFTNGINLVASLCRWSSCLVNQWTATWRLQVQYLPNFPVHGNMPNFHRCLDSDQAEYSLNLFTCFKPNSTGLSRALLYLANVTRLDLYEQITPERSWACSALSQCWGSARSVSWYIILLNNATRWPGRVAFNPLWQWLPPSRPNSQPCSTITSATSLQPERYIPERYIIHLLDQGECEE